MKSTLVFVVGGLVFGLVALGIGYAAAGEEMLIEGSTAFGLAFVPATVAFVWVLFSFRSVPEMQLLATLGSSGLRMIIALGGGFFLTQAHPQTFGVPFWGWLILFYLGLLVLEMTVVVRQQDKPISPAS